MKYWLKTFWVLCLGLLALTACNSDSPTSADSQNIESTELEQVSLKSQNVDSVQLASAFNHAATISGIKALVVVRNGFLLKDAYFNGTKKNNLNHVRSVTKSITSALTGIAMEQGFVEDVNVSMNDILGRSGFLGVNPAKDNITLRHLLNMTSGFEWHENDGNEFSLWVQSGDQVHYVLFKPLQAEPGTQFNYNSGTSHLLSVILTESVGKSTFKFAEQMLFEPLGIRVAWERDARGYYYGGHGLRMRPVDMAKFGILYLQKGRYNGEQIVPEAWVEQSTNPQVAISGAYGAIANLGYGYLWWLDTGGSQKVYLAWGWGGQFIYCVPDFNLVVVTASNWQVSSSTHQRQGQANLDLIVNYVLPAIK